MQAVVVKGLRKQYDGRSVVDGISFQVRAGEVFALLGPNGAGKTTTVEILEGYRRPDAGEVRVLGLNPRTQTTQLRRRIGLMLQQGGLYPQIEVREAAHLFAAFYDDPEDPEALLDRLGLREVQHARFRTLSGGQKQRLSLALALIGRPDLVFLDEPTAAMDPQARRATWSIIRDLRERRVTVLLTTHFMEEAEQLADRVAIIDHGRLVALDSPDALRRAATRELRFSTLPAVTPEAVAAALGLPPAAVHAETDAMVVELEPTPELVASVATWLAQEGVLLTELRAGGRSLEQAFLAITGTTGGEV